MLSHYRKAIEYVDVFSKEDWKKLDEIVENIFSTCPEIIERPASGDSRDEECQLEVIRFITREEKKSYIENEQYTQKILNIFKDANFIKKIQEKTCLNSAPLQILRMQFNSMGKEAFVGPHTDTESDPAYLVSVLIRTTSSYAGGDLCTHGTEPESVSQKPYSVMVMDPSVIHEVKKVTSGKRDTLVAFLGYAPAIEL